MQPAVSDSDGDMRYKHPCNRNPPSDASDVMYSSVSSFSRRVGQTTNSVVLYAGLEDIKKTGSIELYSSGSCPCVPSVVFGPDVRVSVPPPQ